MSHALRLVCCALLFFTVVVVTRGYAAEPVLNGVAIYSELGSEQFVAGLYTSKPTADSKAILLDESDQRMEVRVLAGSLLGNRFKRMWIEGVAINAGTGEMAKHSQNLADFSNLLSIKLQRDDVLTISRQANTTLVRVNNIEIGKIASGEFYNLLLRTWIGPVPLSSTFRDGLLTAGKVDDKTISIYSKINPTPERIAVIKTALLASGKNKAKPLDIAAVKAEQTGKPEALAKSDTTAKPEPSSTGKAEPAVKTEPAVKELAKTDPTKTAVEKPPSKNTDTAVQGASAAGAAVAVAAASQANTQIAAANTATKAPAAPVTKANEVFEEDAKQETADSLLVQQLYIAKLSKRTAGYVKYPKSALSKEQEGTVRVSVTINRAGQVTNVRSSSSNEVAVLTQAAVEAANKASPYPAIPEQIKSDTFTFTIPITFRVKDK